MTHPNLRVRTEEVAGIFFANVSEDGGRRYSHLPEAFPTREAAIAGGREELARRGTSHIRLHPFSRTVIGSGSAVGLLAFGARPDACGVVAGAFAFSLFLAAVTVKEFQRRRAARARVAASVGVAP